MVRTVHEAAESDVGSAIAGMLHTSASIMQFV
jgi:hypothetical protein